MTTKTHYTVVLTKEQRECFQWVEKYRSYGAPLRMFLCSVSQSKNESKDPWYSFDGDLTFSIPQDRMAEYERLISDNDDLSLDFSDELQVALFTPLRQWHDDQPIDNYNRTPEQEELACEQDYLSEEKEACPNGCMGVCHCFGFYP